MTGSVSRARLASAGVEGVTYCTYRYMYWDGRSLGAGRRQGRVRWGWSTVLFSMRIKCLFEGPNPTHVWEFNASGSRTHKWKCARPDRYLPIWIHGTQKHACSAGPIGRLACEIGEPGRPPSERCNGNRGALLQSVARGTGVPPFRAMQELVRAAEASGRGDTIVCLSRTAARTRGASETRLSRTCSTGMPTSAAVASEGVL